MHDIRDGNEWSNLGTSKRIPGLDLLRGFALLGVLLANVHQMFAPWDLANDPIALIAEETGTFVHWFVIDSFVMSKFLTLFSLLFGVGFGIQIASLKGTHNGEYRLIYLRRIAFLGLLGLLHGLFLYAADVLTYYAVTAVFLLLLCELSTKKLLFSGFALTLIVMFWIFTLEWNDSLAALILFEGVALILLSLWLVRNRSLSIVIAGGVTSLLVAASIYGSIVPPMTSDGNRWIQRQHAADTIRSENGNAVTLGDQKFTTPLNKTDRKTVEAMSLNPIDRNKLTTTAYRDGPQSLMIEIRTSQFITTQIGFLIFYFWRTLAIFMIGVGLVKWGLFRKDNSDLYRATIHWGFGIGIPLSLIASYLKVIVATKVSAMNGVATLVHEISVYPVAFALAASVMLWSSSSQAKWLQNILTSAGRMALTNYIGQSLVMLILATGFGLYGTLSRVSLSFLAIIVFGALALCSYIWLMRFRMGPLEWIWRYFTYLKKPEYRDKS